MQPLGRRELLGAAVASGAFLGAGGTMAMPLVPFGKARISRLVLGGNPVGGTSLV